jgi:hypothetical protein
VTTGVVTLFVVWWREEGSGLGPVLEKLVALPGSGAASLAASAA